MKKKEIFRLAEEQTTRYNFPEPSPGIETEYRNKRKEGFISGVEWLYNYLTENYFIQNIEANEKLITEILRNNWRGSYTHDTGIKNSMQQYADQETQSLRLQLSRKEEEIRLLRIELSNITGQDSV